MSVLIPLGLYSACCIPTVLHGKMHRMENNCLSSFLMCSRMTDPAACLPWSIRLECVELDMCWMRCLPAQVHPNKEGSLEAVSRCQEEIATQLELGFLHLQLLNHTDKMVVFICPWMRRVRHFSPSDVARSYQRNHAQESQSGQDQIHGTPCP